MRPLVSVVIPTYNGEKYILATVESVLRQTYQPVEVIVVDDGGQDKTESVLKPLAQRIRFIRKGNGGPASARNLGIRLAKGEFVAFLDGDDLWEADKLEKQMPLFEDRAVGLVYADVSLIDVNDRPLANTVRYTRAQGQVFESLFNKNFIPTSTVVARHASLLRAGFFNEDRELISVEDYDLWLRVAADDQVRHVPEALVKYRKHTSNISSNVERSYFGEKKVLESVVRDFGDRFPAIKTFWTRRLAFLYFELGRDYWIRENLLKAREFFAKSLKLKFSGKVLGYYLSALMGPGWIRLCRKLKKTTRNN